MRPILLTAAAWLAAAPALAETIAVTDPFIYATPARAPVAGGYMVIENAGGDDRLIAARVAPRIAATAQIHEMGMSDGVMRMSEVEGGLPIPAGGTVALERGGLHVMLMGLAGPLAAGAEVPVTLVFETAGEVEVVFEVVERGSR